MEFSCLLTRRCYIYHVINVKNAHFNIYKHDVFYAELSWAWKNITLEKGGNMTLHKIRLSAIRVKYTSERTRLC